MNKFPSLHARPQACLPACIFVYLDVFFSGCLFLCLPCMFVCLSICPSLCVYYFLETFSIGIKAPALGKSIKMLIPYHVSAYADCLVVSLPILGVACVRSVWRLRPPKLVTAKLSQNRVIQ